MKMGRAMPSKPSPFLLWGIFSLFFIAAAGETGFHSGDHASRELLAEYSVETRASELRGIYESRIESLKNIYDKKAKQGSYIWGTRGLPWLLETQELKIGGTVVQKGMIKESEEPYDVGPLTLEIDELRGGKCNSNDLSIWVRITGKEIISGGAKPDPNTCHWTFDFSIAIPGEYTVEAKVVGWKEHLDIDYNQCQLPAGSGKFEQLVQGHNVTDFTGAKFYCAAEQCCEVCTRLPDCTHWETPGNPGFECKFWDLRGGRRRRLGPGVADRAATNSAAANSTAWGEDVGRRRRRRLRGGAQGVARQEATRYYLGCGWSFMLGKTALCADEARDDDVPLRQKVIQVGSTAPEAAAAALEALWAEHQQRPLCSLEGGPEPGRWVDLPQSVLSKCKLKPTDRKQNVPGPFPVQGFQSGDHGICWLQEDVIEISDRCMEPGCKFLAGPSYWDDSEDVLQISDRCMEPGCKFLKGPSYWNKSAVKAKSRREGGVRAYWAPYGDCRWAVPSPREVQRCVDLARLSGMHTEGASIAKFFNHYVDLRLKGIKMYTGERATRLTPSTLALPHLIWHKSEEQMRSDLSELSKSKSTPQDRRYYLNSMFIVSEREAHVVEGRGLRITEFARELLRDESGWRELDFHGPSAAFAFDTATQGDGLHIVGPPMKMVWAQMMTDICRDIPFEEQL